MMFISPRQVFVITFVLLKTVLISAEIIETEDGRIFLIERRRQSNWYEALNGCSSSSGELLVIKSEEENQRIMTLLQQRYKETPRLWLGGHDGMNKKFKYQRKWTSVRGEELTYFYWYKLDPNNYLYKEHCMAISASKYNLKWIDVDCSEKNGYICELYGELFKRCDVKSKNLATKTVEAKDLRSELCPIWEEIKKLFN